MNYRVTCLTPTLVGDGQRLAPIDYMVWRGHVNVLDQNRIFRLLAKGPRLDGYLAQLKKADKLDFASWGGFAQNFAGRRIPFEHESSIPVWEKTRAEQLFIPTFASNHLGPYLPATAIKGALRTGAVHERWTEGTIKNFVERLGDDRLPRNPGSKLEDVPRVRRVAAADSQPGTHSSMKVYLVRSATFASRGGRLEPGWKPDVAFSEMAEPGTQFSGRWSEKSGGDRHKLLNAANQYAAAQLASHQDYAERAGLKSVAREVAVLQQRLAEISSAGSSGLLCVGWGGGFQSKAAFIQADNPHLRGILRQVPAYQRAISTGLPFPKTRRIIFRAGEPTSLPGWVLLEVS